MAEASDANVMPCLRRGDQSQGDEETLKEKMREVEREGEREQPSDWRTRGKHNDITFCTKETLCITRLSK